MNENIIIAAFGAQHETRVRPRYRYDTGQRLIIKTPNGLPDFYEVYFANDGGTAEAEPHLATAEGVLIPDSFFQSGAAIIAWAHVYGLPTEGTTIYKVTIPILNRARPANVEPTPEEQDIIAEVIAALNEAVEEADASASAAATSASEATSSAEDAEAWAVGERNGEPVTRGDETYLNNARHYAAVAQQGAQNAGFAWFDIDDSTGEMNVTVTRDLGEDLEFQINENSGELEVIVHG